MSNNKAIISLPRRSTPNRGATTTTHSPIEPQNVTFTRLELNQILALYGQKVAADEWRDYAIDFTRHKAVFSVFRRTSEVPLYTIEKQPKLARRQGAFAIIAPGNIILRRGHDLPQVLQLFKRKPKLVTY